ncbi:MAG: MarR family transcriptional regulator [Deltaproteobacteria bacterium]|nr:MarR family transcriptional regulator [Deltaproteobacteria bacterium]
MTRAIDLHSRHLAGAFQLTGPQLFCLRTLLRLGPLPPSALAREVSLSQATVTGILDRLENRHLVERARSSRDRRQVIVSVTPQGQELSAAAPPLLQDSLAHHLAELPQEEQANIDQVLRWVVEMMETPELAASSALPAGSAPPSPEAEPQPRA